MPYSIRVFEDRPRTPICIAVTNKDARPSSYKEMRRRTVRRTRTIPIRRNMGSGIGRVGDAPQRAKRSDASQRRQSRSSTRECGAGHGIVAYVKTIHELVASVDVETVKFADVEANIVRCPDAAMAERMIDFIKQVRSEGDSVGGVIECVVRACRRDSVSRSSISWRRNWPRRC
jgi:chorismate synthase